MRFKYVGCNAATWEVCDVCGTKPKFHHKLEASNGVERIVCRACADEMVIPEHRGLPVIAQAWSKDAGGKWVSRWHIEEAYR